MRITYREDTFDKDKLMRCETCHLLLTPDMVHRGVCAGHKLRIAMTMSLIEWAALKLGMLK